MSETRETVRLAWCDGPDQLVPVLRRFELDGHEYAVHALAEEGATWYGATHVATGWAVGPTGPTPEAAEAAAREALADIDGERLHEAVDTYRANLAAGMDPIMAGLDLWAVTRDMREVTP